MPKDGSGTELKAVPSHLPPDISEFSLKDMWATGSHSKDQTFENMHCSKT